MSINNPDYSEAVVSKDVKNKLKWLETQGKIIWWERLKSGKVQSGSSYIHLCRTGTPDFIAVMRNKRDTLTVLFIECKRGNGGRLSPAQKTFMEQHHNGKDILFLVVNDVGVLTRAINDILPDGLSAICF